MSHVFISTQAIWQQELKTTAVRFNTVRVRVRVRVRVGCEHDGLAWGSVRGPFEVRFWFICGFEFTPSIRFRTVLYSYVGMCD